MGSLLHVGGCPVLQCLLPLPRRLLTHWALRSSSALPLPALPRARHRVPTIGHNHCELRHHHHQALAPRLSHSLAQPQPGWVHRGARGHHAHPGSERAAASALEVGVQMPSVKKVLAPGLHSLLSFMLQPHKPATPSHEVLLHLASTVAMHGASLSLKTSRTAMRRGGSNSTSCTTDRGKMLLDRERA